MSTIIVIGLVVAVVANILIKRAKESRRDEREEYGEQSKQQESAQELTATGRDIGPEIESDIIVKVKGTSYRTTEEIGAARMLDEGDTLILEMEPGNQFDPHAIKVLTRTGHCVGYIERAYTELLTRNFAYIRCTVSRIRHTETPFIDARISFSTTRVEQPRVERNPLRLTASERMMIIEEIEPVNDHYQESPPKGYFTYMFLISWRNQLPRENILRAKLCRIGERIRLRLPSDNRYPGRIEVYSTDDILIGYIDEEVHPTLSGMLDLAKDSRIYRLDGECSRLSGIVYLPREKYGEMRGPGGGYFDYPFKEVSRAISIAKEKPIEALELLKFAMEHEKGIDAHDVALSCYWHLKDWEGRKRTAQEMIRRIDAVREDEVDAITYRELKHHRREMLEAMIAYSDKRIASAEKKKRKSE